MPGPIPNDRYALIIGAMKAGTSSLYDYVQGHPELCACRTKEPEYFSDGQTHRTDVDRYADLWDFDPGSHKYAVEASTGYAKRLSNPGVAKKIYDAGLRPKLIYLVRDPFERIVSHYNFMLNFEWWDADLTDDHLLDVSDYFGQLEEYRALFPLEDFLVLDFDELKASPLAVVQKVFAFLGVATDYEPDAYQVKNATSHESPLNRRLKRLGLRSLYQYLPQSVRSFGKQTIAKISRPEKKNLSEAERQLIHDRLLPGMLEFQRVYGFDVTRWGFEAPASVPSG